jgi:glycosyltransferase involved in cell wall biosynthesis
LHICNPPEVYWPLAFASRLVGKQVVFDHHDLSPEMYRAKFGDGGRATVAALRLFERLTFRSADVVLASNESYREVATTRGRRASDDVYVVRSGPPVEQLQRYPADDSFRNGKRYLLGYVGDICEQDGVDHLMRALKVLRDEHGRADVHCLVIGGGPFQPAIREYAAHIGVADLCTFTGFVSVEDWCRLLSSVDVGIEPNPLSEWSDKSTMNKVLDYMYFGTPIVAYDLKENRRSADAAAVYVTPNDERALAAAIDALLDDPARREQMGRFGHERLRRALTWEHSAPRLLAAYDRLAARVVA